MVLDQYKSQRCGEINNHFSGKCFLLYILQIVGINSIAPQTFDVFIAEIALFLKIDRTFFTSPKSNFLAATINSI